MRSIYNVFVGRLKAGQADVEGWKLSEDLSQVHEDGSIYFYDFSDWPLEDILPSVECAFEKDNNGWTITVTKKGPVARIDLD